MYTLFLYIDLYFFLLNFIGLLTSIATLQEARKKLKLAEETSDLSTAEITRKKKSTYKIVEPPQYIENLYDNEQNGKYLLQKVPII